MWVVTLLHLNRGYKARIMPRPHNLPRSEDVFAAAGVPRSVGLFSSRAPHRPNPIGLSALQIVSVNVTAGYVEVRGLDLLHDTPVLDLKPYVAAFDAFPSARAGWMDKIDPDPLSARLRGYQTIHSARGARARRAALRRRNAADQAQLQVTTASADSDAGDAGGDGDPATA